MFIIALSIHLFSNKSRAVVSFQFLFLIDEVGKGDTSRQSESKSGTKSGTKSGSKSVSKPNSGGSIFKCLSGEAEGQVSGDVEPAENELTEEKKAQPIEFNIKITLDMGMTNHCIVFSFFMYLLIELMDWVVLWQQGDTPFSLISSYLSLMRLFFKLFFTIKRITMIYLNFLL